MPIIEWNVGFLIGIQEIDKHHKQMVHLLNEAYDVFREGGNVGEPVIVELLSYADQVFTLEENLMRKTAYPGLAKHAEEHKSFLSRVTGFKDTFRKNKNISIEILWFLCNWVTHHMRETDEELGRHVGIHTINKKMHEAGK